MSVTLQLLKRRRAQWLALSVIVGLALWWFAIMTPLSSKLAGAERAQASAQLTHSTLLTELSQLRDDRRAVASAKSYLRRFDAAVPSTADAPGLVVQVYDLAEREGVRLTSITDNSVVGNAGYSTIPVSIEANGSHDALISFVDGLYNIPRLLTIQSLDLSGSSSVNQPGTAAMTATISATAYTLQPASAGNSAGA